MIVVDERIVQRVALQEEFEDRLGELRSFGDSVALGHRPRADVAHHAFDGKHLHRPDQRFTLVQHADEMRRHPGRGELAHHVRIDLVVGLAFLLELRELHAVERRHVVPIVHHEMTRIVRRVDRLRLALVELLPLFHRRSRQSSRHSNPASCSATPIQSCAQPSAADERGAGELPRIVLPRQVRGEDVDELRIVEPREQRAGGPVVEMAEAGRDALLERRRIAAVLQHVEVVIALEHQRVASGQAVLDVQCRDAEIGEDAHAPGAVADHVLHGLARVVRHRDRNDFEHAYREPLVAVESVDWVIPSKRSATTASVPNVAHTGIAVPRGERGHAADVIGVLVGDEDR